MTWISIIEMLPKIIFYLASGYIFMHTFFFFAYKEPVDDDIQGKITLSLVIGFVLKQLLSLIPVRFSFTINYVFLLFISFIVAFALAKLWRTKIFNSILTKFGTERTVNKFFWDDILDDKTYIQVTNYSNEYTIIGLCAKIEEFKEKPQILMEHYRIIDLEGNIIEDYKNDKKNFIVVNLEKYDYVQIVYNKSSKLCSKIDIEE